MTAFMDRLLDKARRRLVPIERRPPSALTGQKCNTSLEPDNWWKCSSCQRVMREIVLDVTVRLPLMAHILGSCGAVAVVWCCLKTSENVCSMSLISVFCRRAHEKKLKHTGLVRTFFVLRFFCPALLRL